MLNIKSNQESQKLHDNKIEVVDVHDMYYETREDMIDKHK